MHPTAKAINVIIDEGKLVHFERERALRTLWINLLARMHPFLLGPPGTNKTRLIDWVCQSIDGATFWEQLCNNQLGLEDFFGPIDMVAFDKHGVWHRNVDGYMPTAHVVMLDEVFKANGAILNPLLDALVRFQVKVNSKPLAIPTLMFAMASNELPQGQELGAFWDRRGSALVLNYIQGEGDFDKLLQLAAGDIAVPDAANRTTVALDDINEAVFELVPKIDVPEGIRDALRQLKSVCEHPPADDNGPRIIVSDRRWVQAVRLLKASAFLNGRSAIDDDDLIVLRDFLWETPEMISTVDKRVTTLASPQTAKAMEVNEQVDEWLTKIAASRGKAKDELAKLGAEINGKIRKMNKELAEVRQEALSAGRGTTKIDEVQDRVGGLLRSVLVECIGLPPETADKAAANASAFGTT